MAESSQTPDVHVVDLGSTDDKYTLKTAEEMKVGISDASCDMLAAIARLPRDVRSLHPELELEVLPGLEARRAALLGILSQPSVRPEDVDDIYGALMRDIRRMCADTLVCIGSLSSLGRTIKFVGVRSQAYGFGGDRKAVSDEPTPQSDVGQEGAGLTAIDKRAIDLTSRLYPEAGAGND